MKNKIPVIAQFILGLIFFVFGLNGFLNFIPMPPMPDNIKAFFGALLQTGYFFPVLKGTEVLCGLLLLLRVCSALALVILAPIVIQIFLFHLYMAPDGLPLASVIVALEAYLGFIYYRPAFANVLQAKPLHN